jgi:hypothetical protein
VGYTLKVVLDEDGLWMRKLGINAPYHFNAVFHFEDDDIPALARDYTVVGLDYRKHGTPEKAQDEAALRMNLESSKVPKGYTEEQKQASRDYNQALSYYQHASLMIKEELFKDGNADTDTTLDMTRRKQEWKEAFLFARSLGVHMVGYFD